MTALTVVLSILALFNAVNAGVFLAFSTMVSPALRDTGPSHTSAAVMRHMTVLAPRTIFMVPFLGAPLAAFVGGVVVFITGALASPFLSWSGVIAGILTVTAFVVSLAVNIPWNERLVRHPGDEDMWMEFSRVWPRGNTARCVLSVLAAITATFALVG